MHVVANVAHASSLAYIRSRKTVDAVAIKSKGTAPDDGCAQLLIQMNHGVYAMPQTAFTNTPLNWQPCRLLPAGDTFVE